MPLRKLLGGLVLGLLLTAQSCVRLAPRVTAPTVQRSGDAGASWEARDFVERYVEGKRERVVTISGVSATQLLFSRAAPELMLLLTAGNGLYISRNQGDQWVATAYRGPVVTAALDPVNDQILLVTDGRAIQRSTDGGRTWPTIFTLTKPDERLVGATIDTYTPTRLLAVANVGLVYESLDAGVTWRIRSRVDDTLTNVWLHPQDSRVVFATGKRSALWRSTDSGATWTSLDASFEGTPEQRTGLRLFFFNAAAPTLYSLGGHGLLTSADLGTTWTAIRTLVPPPAAITTVSVDPTDPQRIAFVLNARLHRTDDNGATWTVTTLPTNRPVTFLTRDARAPNSLYLGVALPPKR